MNQIDFVGDIPAPAVPPPKSRATSIEEAKQWLRGEIELVCSKVPAGVVSGSANSASDWLEAREAALKVSKRAKATVQELTAAISSMRRHA